MADTIKYRFTMRRGLAASWQTLNEILLEGEYGYEKDTGKIKVGDGVTAWNSLDYFGAAVPLIPGEGINIDYADPERPVISSTVAAISLSGRVTNYASLPTGLISSDAGKAYLNQQDSLIYVWNGTSFQNDGEGLSVTPSNKVDLNAVYFFGFSTKGFWFDFTDKDTLFQDTAGTVPVTASGQKVAFIKDKSGLGFHGIQANPANQGTFITNVFKQSYLQVTSSTYYTNGKSTNAENLFTLASINASGSNQRLWDNRGQGTAGTVKGSHFKPVNNGSDTFLVDDGVGHALQVYPINASINTDIVVSGTYNGSTKNGRYTADKTEASLTNASLASIVNSNDNYIFTSKGSIGSQNFTGKVYMVMVSDVVPDDEHFFDAWLYAKSKLAAST